MSVDEFLRDYAIYHPDGLILAAIDPADDLFVGTTARESLRQRFLQELATAVAQQPRLRLLVSTRSASLPDFTNVLGDGVQFHLDPLTPSKAIAAAKDPGFFTSDAASTIVQGLREPDASDIVEPVLLQIVCASLWRSLREHTSEGNVADLERFADAPVDAALTAYCGEAIAAVAAIHEIPVDWLHRWLIDTFLTETGAPTTAPETLATVLQALEDRHLLRAEALPPGSTERRYRLLSARLAEPLRASAGLVLDGEPLIGDPDEYLGGAERARVMGEYDLARKIAAQVLRAVPPTDLRRHAEAHSLIGDVAYELGRFDEAEDSYRTAQQLFRVIGDNTAVARLFAAVARTYIARGKLAEGLEELAAAVRAGPEHILQDELVDVMSRLTEGAARKRPFGASRG